MKKIIIFIIIILVVFIIYLFIIKIPRNYKLKYFENKYSVYEEYNKNIKQYKFKVTINNRDYPITFYDNYTKKRRHISDITLFEDKDKDITCLSIKYKLNKYPICYQGKELIDYRLLNSEFIKESFNLTIKENGDYQDYNNIKIFDYNNSTYLIWDYKGFIILKDNNNEIKKILENDNYQNELSFQNKDYLIIPNYDDDYFFDEIFIYDNNTLNIRLTKFDFSISHSSYFLGSYNNSFYLFDKKSKTEYAINAKKSKITKVSDKQGVGKTYDDGWKEISTTRLYNVETKFKMKKFHEYVLENQKLYMKIDDSLMLLTNYKVDKIIYESIKGIYFLVKDTLYIYEYTTGVKKLLQYKEWNFNNLNQIFIFD